MTTWSKSDLDRMIQLWNADFSAADIGKLIGRNRNEILGQVFRLRQKGILPKTERVIPVRRSVATSSNTQQVKRSRPPLARSLAIKAILAEHMPPGKKTFLELTFNDCRWPLGADSQPAVFFCGDPVIPERSYCPAHCDLARRRRH